MTAKQFAKKQGFTDAAKIEPWNGYKCYEAIYSEPSLDVPKIGIPQIILERNGIFRMATYAESMQYMDKMTGE